MESSGLSSAMSLKNFFLKFSLIFLFITGVISSIGISGDEEFDGQLALKLEHSFDSGSTPQYTPRGLVTVRSLKKGEIQIPPVQITEEEKLKLKELVKRDLFYRIRVLVKHDLAPHYLTTFVKACALYDSKLSDILTLHVDTSGDLVGISATTTRPYCLGIELFPSELQSFNTVVGVRPMELGPAPDTTAFLQKIDKEKADKTKSEQGDNRSFFAKYWMYILPVVIFVFISGIANPEGQAGGNR